MLGIALSLLMSVSQVMAQIQVGIASWYGKFFHGRKMANGQPFDKNQVSAASRWIPLGTEIRVTNLDNGKSLDMTVTDRGPYHGDRIIDLSQRAAQLLGFIEKGIQRVKVEIIGKH